MKGLTSIILATALLELISPQLFANETHECDVIIYGGTSAAVTAAVQIKRMKKVSGMQMIH